MNGSNLLKTQKLNQLNMKTFLNPLRVRLTVLGLTGSLVLAGAVFALAQSSKTKTNPTDLNVPVDQTAVPRDGLPRGSFAPIVDKVAPAVVKIEITATSRNTAMEGMPRLLCGSFSATSSAGCCRPNPCDRELNTASAPAWSSPRTVIS